ncbi:hypothetical protein NDU88_005712 [Pleurodeles waltl]|uniref:Uncharacterized protein n=1 Tax=Pleurodeles waltl TaxID=8319 RepID=A0AAV7QJ17_PLEWA|nr:hypothetical protein NDU88_005712 [Pleurodeles waltl]
MKSPIKVPAGDLLLELSVQSQQDSKSSVLLSRNDIPVHAQQSAAFSLPQPSPCAAAGRSWPESGPALQSLGIITVLAEASQTPSAVA